MNSIKKAISVPDEYGSLLDEMTDRDKGVFGSMAAAVVFAAALGFKEKRPRSLVGRKLRPHPLKPEVFRDPMYHTLYDNITLLHAIDDSDIDDETDQIFGDTANENYKHEVFSTYMAGGFEIIFEDRAVNHTKDIREFFKDWVDSLID
jgi:dnd system-associated protein 4